MLARGRVLTGRSVVVRVRPNGLASARLGIIAARRAIPRAVDRNRGKRLVREVFRAAQRRLAPLDVVVQLRGVVPRQGGAPFRQELLGIFAGLGRVDEA